jgi:hypothetical protein
VNALENSIGDTLFEYYNLSIDDINNLLAEIMQGGEGSIRSFRSSTIKLYNLLFDDENIHLALRKTRLLGIYNLIGTDRLSGNFKFDKIEEFDAFEKVDETKLADLFDKNVEIWNDYKYRAEPRDYSYHDYEDLCVIYNVTNHFNINKTNYHTFNIDMLLYIEAANEYIEYFNLEADTIDHLLQYDTPETLRGELHPLIQIYDDFTDFIDKNKIDISTGGKKMGNMFDSIDKAIFSLTEDLLKIKKPKKKKIW